MLAEPQGLGWFRGGFRCLGRACRNIPEQLFRLSPRGARVILAGKCTQGGDSVPSFWEHPSVQPTLTVSPPSLSPPD